jgi:2'-5' RNA ligase
MPEMYFIALVAPEEVNQQVLRWKNFMKENYGCVVALRSPAHITLIPPFWMDRQLEEDLKADITTFSNGGFSFPIELRNFSAFQPKVIFIEVVENNALQTLQSHFESFLVSKDLYPIKADSRPFHPHVTIANRDLHKKAFYEAWQILKEKPFHANWVANGISLLKHNQKKWDVVFTSQTID